MDEDGEHENRRHRMDCHRVPSWTSSSQFPMREQNAFHVTAKINMLYDERDTATKERDRAIAEKKAALMERDTAIQQRDAAIADRDNALRERDNAVAALQFQENAMNAMSALWGSVARGHKRPNRPSNQNPNNVKFARSLGEGCITDALPITVVPSDDASPDQTTRVKVKKNVSAKVTKSPSKLKKVREDLNRHVTTAGTKAEWDAQEYGSVDLIHFDESSMPPPVCSCTGVPRQCYKWGNGGWQSSCCTTSLSVYPLPQMPNKKHSRIGGRKMSGSVFSRLITRVASAGHDLSIPIDLKNYWAKHGTNRYITIK